MEANARPEPRRQEVRPGLIAKCFATVAQGVKWLLLSLVFSVIIEWVGMTFWWLDARIAHSREMLLTEIGYLQTDLGRSFISADPTRFTKTIADRTYYVLFELTRITDFIDWIAQAPASRESSPRQRLHAFLRATAEYLLVAIQVTQVFSVRLAILVLAMPIFVMFSLVAVVDGLVQRDLRRWGGGRESSFVYHWAKRAALPLLALTWILYLALPFSLHPSFVVLPFATLFALSVAVTASTFKKYL